MNTTLNLFSDENAFVPGSPSVERPTKTTILYKSSYLHVQSPAQLEMKMQPQPNCIGFQHFLCQGVLLSSTRLRILFANVTSITYSADRILPRRSNRASDAPFRPSSIKCYYDHPCNTCCTWLLPMGFYPTNNGLQDNDGNCPASISRLLLFSHFCLSNIFELHYRLILCHQQSLQILPHRGRHGWTFQNMVHHWKAQQNVKRCFCCSKFRRNEAHERGCKNKKGKDRWLKLNFEKKRRIEWQ